LRTRSTTWTTSRRSTQISTSPKKRWRISPEIRLR
jgi:hypothetical protein